MPFYVIRRNLSAIHPLYQTQYVSKRGDWDHDFKKARIFANIGAVKNSISHWGAGDNDAEIVEMELKPTRVVGTVGEVMAPISLRRLRLIQERRAREAQMKKEAELAELKRLKEKYE